MPRFGNGIFLSFSSGSNSPIVTQYQSLKYGVSELDFDNIRKNQVKWDYSMIFSKYTSVTPYLYDWYWVTMPLGSSVPIFKKIWPQDFSEWDHLILPDFARFDQNLSRWPHILMIDIDAPYHWETLCQILENSDRSFLMCAEICAMKEGQNTLNTKFKNSAFSIQNSADQATQEIFV